MSIVAALSRGAAVAENALVVTCTGVASTSLTYYNSNIRSDHVVVSYVLSNPAAQISDITVTTSNGSLVFSNGFASGGTTNITLTLMIQGQAVNATTTA